MCLSGYLRTFSEKVKNFCPPYFNDFSQLCREKKGKIKIKYLIILYFRKIIVLRNFVDLTRLLTNVLKNGDIDNGIKSERKECFKDVLRVEIGETEELIATIADEVDRKELQEYLEIVKGIFEKVD